MPKRWALDEVSPFEHVRVLDPEPVAADIDAAKANLARAFPIFKDVPIAERWGGLIDATPDAVPVISPVETIPGFFIATGFSGHGFGIGPVTGPIAARLALGRDPGHEVSAFRYGRFAAQTGPDAPLTLHG